MSQCDEEKWNQMVSALHTVLNAWHNNGVCHDCIAAALHMLFEEAMDYSNDNMGSLESTMVEVSNTLH